MQNSSVTSKHRTTAFSAMFFPYGSGRFQISEKGVFFIGKDRDGNEQS
jgi:hypothetical protein